MPAKWSDIVQDERVKSLPVGEFNDLQQRYYDNVITQSESFKGAAPQDQHALENKFFLTQPDTIEPYSGNFAQKAVGAAVKGWTGLEKAVLNMPKRFAAMAKEGTAMSPYAAGFAQTPAGKKVYEEEISPEWYKEKVKNHARGVELAMKAHPEWESEPPKGFVDLITSPDKLALSLIESAPLLVAAGVTAAVGAPQVGFAMMYAAEGQQAYDQAIADGATEDQANMVYHTYGSVAAVLENLQLKGIMKGWSKAKRAMFNTNVTLKVAGKSITKDVVKLAAQEAAEEMAQQGWQEATAKLVYDKDPTGGWRGVVDRQLMAGTTGFAMGLIPGLGGAITGGTQAAIDQKGGAPIEADVLTREREQEISDGVGAEPTDLEMAAYHGLGAGTAETGLFESEKIAEQQAAEAEGTRKLVEQEQGERAFTPDEVAPVVTPEKPVVVAGQPEEPKKKAPNTRIELDTALEKLIPLHNTGQNQMREKLGLTELPSPERKAKQVSINNAIRAGIPEKAMDMASELIVTPRVISDEELAGMGVKLVQLDDQLAGADKAFDTAKNSAEESMATAKIEILDRQIDLLTLGMNKAKSEIGRALSMAGTDIAPGYGAKSVKRRMKKAKGKDLTPKENAAIDKLTKQLEEANTELTELQEKQKNDTVQRFVRSAKRGTPRSVTQRTADVQTLGKKINQLLEQGCI